MISNSQSFRQTISIVLGPVTAQTLFLMEGPAKARRIGTLNLTEQEKKERRNDICKEVGGRIRRLREAAGLSKEELAEAVMSATLSWGGNVWDSISSWIWAGRLI